MPTHALSAAIPEGLVGIDLLDADVDSLVLDVFVASPPAQKEHIIAQLVGKIYRDAPLIEAALQAAQVPLIHANSLPDAVQRAARLAKVGEAVLLSPACASWDMFDGYAHRAQVFCEAVQALAERGDLQEDLA